MFATAFVDTTAWSAKSNADALTSVLAVKGDGTGKLDHSTLSEETSVQIAEYSPVMEEHCHIDSRQECEDKPVCWIVEIQVCEPSGKLDENGLETENCWLEEQQVCDPLKCEEIEETVCEQVEVQRQTGMTTGRSLGASITELYKAIQEQPDIIDDL